MPTKTANHETEQHDTAQETHRASGGYYSASEPCTVVLFGASGDVAKRKVIPAMFDLARHNALGSSYAIVGFARTPMNDESFRNSIEEAAKINKKANTPRTRSMERVFQKKESM